MKCNKDFRECVSIVGILMITEHFLMVADESDLPDAISGSVYKVTAEMVEMRDSVYKWLEDNLEDDGN